MRSQYVLYLDCVHYDILTTNCVVLVDIVQLIGLHCAQYSRLCLINVSLWDANRTLESMFLLNVSW
jgi:hypothetical protein